MDSNHPGAMSTDARSHICWKNSTCIGHLCQLRDTIDVEVGLGWQIYWVHSVILCKLCYRRAFGAGLLEEEDLGILWASLYIFTGNKPSSIRIYWTGMNLPFDKTVLAQGSDDLPVGTWCT